MATDAYQFPRHGAGQQYNYYQQHGQRHLARNGSPVNGNRGTYTVDTPSPSRSPVSSQTQSYQMYGQAHQQNQNMMLNGGHHQRYMQLGIGQKQNNHAQQQSQQQQQFQGQQNSHHQQNHGATHGNVSHQQTFSSGSMSNVTPHFAPSNLHNGNTSNSQVHLDHLPAHHQQQLQLWNECRNANTDPHRHCRKEGSVRMNRTTEQIAPTEAIEEDKEERNRVTSLQAVRRQDWDAIDFSGQGLKTIAPALFNSYMFLRKLFLDHNRLIQLDPRLGQLRCLEELDVSSNGLIALPEEIGMLVNLKRLLLFDNSLSDLPNEIGHLFKLEMLGIEGNPMLENMKEYLAEHGTKALITNIKEDTTFDSSIPPEPRQWNLLDTQPAAETMTVVSYNILCDKYATTSLYGYTPTEALSWDYRKKRILHEINEQDADVVCLQEVDRESFDDYFRRELALKNYRGIFWPKSRAKTMPEKEAKLVDGCATFFKSSKYHLLDKQLIDFANTAINRPDMKGEHDTFNRVMPRDHIAVATFLENRITGSRLIVLNAHIFWDPEYADVKLVQVAIMMESLAKFAEKWAKEPACTSKVAFRHSDLDIDSSDTTSDVSPELAPSLEYSSGPQIPLVICGDFNSAAGTGVYDLITRGNVPGDHPDLANRGYGTFTRDGMAHPFKLKSAYDAEPDLLSLTNYVPTFQGVIDYIWYSTTALQVRGLLGDVDQEYLKRVPGFPNYYFPSDHLPLKAEFAVKPQKAVSSA